MTENVARGSAPGPRRGGSATPDPAIRLLAPADIALYKSLRLEALERHPEAFGASLEDEAAQPDSFFAERLAGNAIFAIRDASGTPAGLMGLHIPSATKSRHKGLVWTVYIRPEARGQGLGRRLLEALLDHARSRVEEVRLGVSTTNHPAIRLYESAGFTAFATEPRALKIGDTYYDETLMLLRFAGPG